MADLIPFPLRRNVGKARHVAALVATKRGRDRDTYYSTACDRLAKQLRRIGFAERVVREQVQDFTFTVDECIAEGWHYPGRPSIADHEAAEMARSIEENHGPGAA